MLSINRTTRKVSIHLIIDATLKLVGSGADFIILCANTLHQFVERLEQEIDVPIIHIAEAAADEIRTKEDEQDRTAWHKTDDGNGLL